jgi:hypothetical protein
LTTIHEIVFIVIKVTGKTSMSSNLQDALLGRELVRLNAAPASKEAAITEACQLLAAAGCVAPGFAASMLRREAVANTFLGHGVAIPHGLLEDKDMVRHFAGAGRPGMEPRTNRAAYRRHCRAR